VKWRRIRGAGKLILVCGVFASNFTINIPETSNSTKKYNVFIFGCFQINRT
jgi:hypothetical protein